MADETKNLGPVEIRNRWTGAVMFTAQVDLSLPFGLRLGAAVKIAIEARANLSCADLTRADLTNANLSRANLSCADLSDANLSDADLTRANLLCADLSDANLTRADLSCADLSRANLSDANLTRADLTRADLSDANLTRANLRVFKSDLWMILTQNKLEVPGVLGALKEGRVDGSVYHGACACLVGTIANVRGVDPNCLEQDAGRPAERWFMMIRPGDKPENRTGGGLAARLAVEWIEEWQSFNPDTARQLGIAVTP